MWFSTLDDDWDFFEKFYGFIAESTILLIIGKLYQARQLIDVKLGNLERNELKLALLEVVGLLGEVNLPGLLA